LLACALQHRHSADGNLPRSERPERLRSGILARLPPASA
jgi:predicted metal-binding protein